MIYCSFFTRRPPDNSVRTAAIKNSEELLAWRMQAAAAATHFPYFVRGRMGLREIESGIPLHFNLPNPPAASATTAQCSLPNTKTHKNSTMKKSLHFRRHVMTSQNQFIDS